MTKTRNSENPNADHGGRAVGLRPLDYWDCGFEFRWRHGACYLCLFVLVEASETGRSLVQGSPAAYVCLCVIKRSSNSTATMV